MADKLEEKIIHQIEYYFGDINLPRDKFMQEKLKEDDGWISLDVLLTFKRLANLSTDQEVIANAVEKSDKKLVIVSEDRKKLRRSPEHPLPEFNEERRKELISRTAYAKGFPPDEELDVIMKFFEDEFGKIESCTRRTYMDKATKEQIFKGSCYIIFSDVEACKKFVEQESVKYKDTELIRKWQSNYFEEKKKEFESRKKKKDEKKSAEVEGKKINLPKGAIIHFTDVNKEDTLTREEIKEKIKEIGEMDTSYIDYNKGDAEGHVRFPNENNAIEFHKKLTDGQLEIGQHKLKVRVLEGEEEENFLKKAAECVKMRHNNKKGNKHHRKRKGHFADNGPKNKVKG